MKAEAINWITQNAATNTFAASLQSQFKSKGSLSDRQWAAALKAAQNSTKPKEEARSVDSFPNIRALIDSALHNSSLKAPMFKYKGIKFKMAASNSRHAGRIWVGDYPSMGTIELDGTLTSWRGLSDENLAIIKELEANPEQKLAEHGKALNSCCYCSKELSDDRSVDHGYGPICAKNWGLPWGKDS